MIQKLKSILLRGFAVACFMIAGAVASAQGASPATNIVTVFWSAPVTSPVPYLFRVYSNTNALAPKPWPVLTNLTSSGQISLTFLTAKAPMTFFYVTSYNATNAAWESDPSNVVSTLWPVQGDFLQIRLGP